LLYRSVSVNNPPFPLGAFIDQHIVFITAVVMFAFGLLAAHLIYSSSLRQARRELERLQLQLQTEAQIRQIEKERQATFGYTQRTDSRYDARPVGIAYWSAVCYRVCGGLLS